MALHDGRVVKLKRGDYSEVSKYTPAVGELIMDLTNLKLIIGDGKTIGGHIVCDIIVNPETNYLYARVETLGELIPVGMPR